MSTDLKTEALPPAELDIYLDEEESTLLRDTIGDAADGGAPIRLHISLGHSGYGLYVSQSDYPEEGSILLTQLNGPAPAGGADPVAVFTFNRLDYEALDAIPFDADWSETRERKAYAKRVQEAVARSFEWQLKCHLRALAAPTAQPQPVTEFMRAALNVEHSLLHDGPGDVVIALREKLLPVLSGMLDDCGYLPDLQRAAPTLLNGLTEQETAASASVAGLSGARPEAPWVDPLLGRYAQAVARVEAAQPERYVSALDPLMQAVGKTWSAHGRDDGMRVPEASDLTGGSTDRAAHPEAPAEPSDEWIDSAVEQALGSGSHSAHFMRLMRIAVRACFAATPAPAAQQPAELTGDMARAIARSVSTSASDSPFPVEYVAAGWRAAIKAQGGSL
jgi:hypothetical protein